MSMSLEDVDVFRLIRSDPHIGLAIVTVDGDVVEYCETSKQMLGLPTEVDYRGKNIRDIFDPRFAEERLQWIHQSLQEKRALRTYHLFRGQRMRSTIVPLLHNDWVDCVALISRFVPPDQRSEPDGDVETKYIDLGELSVLSPRELEVLVLLGHGRTVPEAARMLHRSPRTIERHKSAIGEKLGLSRIAQISHLVGKVGLTIDDLELQRIEAMRPDLVSPQ